MWEVWWCYFATKWIAHERKKRKWKKNLSDRKSGDGMFGCAHEMNRFLCPMIAHSIFGSDEEKRNAQFRFVTQFGWRANTSHCRQIDRRPSKHERRTHNNNKCSPNESRESTSPFDNGSRRRTKTKKKKQSPIESERWAKKNKTCLISISEATSQSHGHFAHLCMRHRHTIRHTRGDQTKAKRTARNECKKKKQQRKKVEKTNRRCTQKTDE